MSQLGQLIGHPPLVSVGPKNPHEFSASQGDLPGMYQEVLRENPLLRRIETQLKLLAWTEEQIRTFQLLVACQSNATLVKECEDLRARELMLPQG